MRAIVDTFTKKGRKVKTSSVRGFLMLYIVASLKPWRQKSLRYPEEQARITQWLDKVVEIAPKDYPLAVELAHVIGMVKGYGETHERGRARYEAVMAILPKLVARGDAAKEVAILRKAAASDESGEAFNRALAAIA